MKQIPKKTLLITPRNELINLIIKQSLIIESQSLLADKLQNYIKFLEDQAIKLKCMIYEKEPEEFLFLDDLPENKKDIPEKE